MDYLNQLLNQIESELTLFDIIRIGGLQDANSIAVRQYPTSPGARFYDGGRIDEFGVQLLVKHDNATISRETIQTIADYLKEVHRVTSADGSFYEINMDCTTEPNWLEVADNKTIYTALFEAELYREGK